MIYDLDVHVFMFSCFRYDEDLQCAFDPTRLNFSVHVRLGDRVASAENLAKHFRLLEELMDIIASVMRERRLQPPLFHVFSETEHPCPSPETGLFDEFPVWPVELDQVRNRIQGYTVRH